MLMIFLCCREVLPVPGDQKVEETIDPATQYVTGGNLLMLDGFKDNYTLDEDIFGVFRVINQTDTAGLSLHADSKSPYRLHITPLQSIDIVFFDPTVTRYEEFSDTLRRGDTLSYQLVWSQKTWNSTMFFWTDLKAFSGSYMMVVFFRGNPMFTRSLTRFFEISEEGDPLSASLEIDHQSHDSVKADFVIRNRTSRPATIEAVDPLPLRVTYLQSLDTVLAHQYPLAPNVLALPPRSDKRIPFLRAANTDGAYARLRGAFDLHAILRLKSRVLTASAVGYLP